MIRLQATHGTLPAPAAFLAEGRGAVRVHNGPRAASIGNGQDRHQYETAREQKMFEHGDLQVMNSPTTKQPSMLQCAHATAVSVARSLAYLVPKLWIPHGRLASEGPT